MRELYYIYSTTDLSKNSGILQLTERVTFVRAHWPDELEGPVYSVKKMLESIWCFTWRGLSKPYIELRIENLREAAKKLGFSR